VAQVLFDGRRLPRASPARDGGIEGGEVVEVMNPLPWACYRKDVVNWGNYFFM
jgi:hypothetical protein